MDIVVYGALLLAAASHAGWNALVKVGDDKFHSMVLVAAFTSLVSALFLPFANLLSASTFAFIGASLCFHFFYKLCLAEAYRWGDLAQIYPIARGVAPLLVLLGAFLFIGEHLSFVAILFIGILVSGVLLVSIFGGWVSGLIGGARRAIFFALLTAFFIAGYSLIDGLGARFSGDAFSYTIWLMSLDGLLFLAFAYYRRGKSLWRPLRQHWRVGILGGSLSLVAYGIALWAMTKVPLALVSGLRETSILFAMLLAWIFVKEPMNRYRIIAAMLIVAGVIGIKFA